MRLITTLPQKSFLWSSYPFRFYQKFSNLPSTNMQMSSSSKSKARLSPDGIFVQALPVFIPSINDEALLSKTHLSTTNRDLERNILLCKWNSGDFEGRYTGLIRRLSKDQLELVENKPLIEKHEILREAAKDLLPSSLQPLVKALNLVGLLRFEDPPVYDEYVYIVNLAPSSSNESRVVNRRNNESESSAADVSSLLLGDEIIRFDRHPCSWFRWENIPFPEMPADDELWYPKVLWEGRKVKGSFTFGGWSEKTIKSYELYEVEKIE